MYKPSILNWRKAIIESNKIWKLVNWCEFDQYAAKSYCAIHNETEDKNLGDITEVNEKEIKDFNWGCGGSPCQDFSVAGKQEGSKWTCKDCEHEYNPLEAHYSKRDECPKCDSKNINKTRSSLIVELLRIIREKKPNVFLYENVKNLVGKQFKITFDLFITEIKEYGYNCYYEVLNAKNYGIPQNRERVYLIIIKSELDNGKFKFPKPFDNGIRLKDILEKEVEEKFYISQDKVDQLLRNIGNRININAQVIGTCHPKNDLSFATRDKVYSENCLSPTLTSTMYKDAPKVIQVGNIINTGNWDNPQRGRIYSSDGCSPALNCCGGGGLEPKILQKPAAIRGRYSKDGDIIQQLEVGSDEYTNTITTVQKDNVIIEDSIMLNNIEKGEVVILDDTKSERFGGGKLFDTCPTLRASRYGHKVINTDDVFRIRKLTPKECFRLMGFSDWDFTKAEFVVSNSQLYKQSGNSIVVDVVYYILKNLYKAMPYLFDDIKLSSFFSGIGAFEVALNNIFRDINSGTIENFIQPQEE